MDTSTLLQRILTEQTEVLLCGIAHALVEKKLLYGEAF